MKKNKENYRLSIKQTKLLGNIKLWGAATSAHQVEGGNSNQWSEWETANASELAKSASGQFAHWLPAWKDVKNSAVNPDNYKSNDAADHYNRYEEDFDIMSDLYFNAYRFSIEWSRIEPEEGKWDQKEIEHYKKYIKELKKRNIEPVVTLWHWTTPVWFDDIGGFRKRKNIRFFERFAKKILEELGDDFTYVCILNEPNVYVMMGIMEKRWPPQDGSIFVAICTMFNLVKTHKIVRLLYDKHNVGIAYAVSHTARVNNLPHTVLISRVFDYMWNVWFLARIKNATDFIGINHYFTTTWKGFKQVDTGGNKSDYGWEMQPYKLKFAVQSVSKRFKKPVMITENGLADQKDQYRDWWIHESLVGLSEAIDEGAEVIGYMHWSLLDNFEWAEGFWPRFGLIGVDYENMSRTVRPSAKRYGSHIKKIRKSVEKTSV